ncbi:MAG TPA: nitroreductase family protein [Deltaproteobacteria bacterium]|nr:nitroreductase family protein [Deltaproteobacteria bacterium]HOM28007.1 nitroreductase family protein [Deltaproteobacteria bacterium]HPP80851.1 nitroreductase family protein [Deltaproteobacteria bacterium]
MLDLIVSRRSIRSFEPRPVGEGLVERILEAGRWAPSGMNNQPWRFAVITDRGLVEQVSRLTRYSRILAQAPVLVAVFLDMEASYHRTKDVQAIGACIQNMLLEAHAEGLGAVWIGEILRSEAELKELLEAPEGFELMAVLAVGHPRGPAPRPPARKALEELVFFRK